MPLTLLDFQVKPSSELERITGQGRNVYLQGVTGSGKTYTIAKALENITKTDAFKDFDELESTRPCNVLILCPKSVKYVWQGVIKEARLKATRVMSYGELRTSAGERAFGIEWKSYVDSKGDIAYAPEWPRETMPLLLVLDEVHNVKNPESQQSQVVIEYIKAKQGRVIATSATPFVKLEEAFVLALAAGLTDGRRFKRDIEQLVGPWIDISKASPEGSKRFREALQEADCFAEITGVKFLHQCRTRTLLTDFDTPEDAKFYNNYYANYIAVLAKAGKYSHAGSFEVLREWNKLREASDHLRVKPIAREAIRLHRDENKSVIIFSNFVEPLRKYWKELVRVHGINPDRISFVLGGQKEEERNEQIRKFQEGRADFCLATLKTGKEGISLDHCPAFADVNRPRAVLLPCDWSPISMLQAAGRAHRVLTQSTTYLYVHLFKGTIEEHVKNIASNGTAALREILTRKESLLDIFNQAAGLDSKALAEVNNKLIEDTADIDEESGEALTYADNLLVA